MDDTRALIYMASALGVGAIIADTLRRNRTRYYALKEAATPKGPSSAALIQAALNDHIATRRSPEILRESIEQNAMRNKLHESYLRALQQPERPYWVDEMAGIDRPALDVQITRIPVFKAQEPRTLATYIGQRTICTQLDLSIRALGESEFVLPHKLLTGLPGFGKTLLAKIIAHTLDTRASNFGKHVEFIETYAANLNSVEALDTVVRSCDPNTWTVWFIDEIHVLTKELATKLYLLMEDGRYPFYGEGTPTAFPRIMLLGATTDYGALHPALKRRFGESVMLEPLSYDELLAMVQSLGFPITLDAAKLLASRCVHSGAPHEIKTLFGECVVVAKATKERTITEPIVETVFTTYGVDRLGLRPIDRKVIRAFRTRPRYATRTGQLTGYGGSENDICTVSGVDKGEFREVIRPRLMARGLIEVRPGIGLALTTRAVTEYPN